MIERNGREPRATGAQIPCFDYLECSLQGRIIIISQQTLGISTINGLICYLLPERLPVYLVTQRRRKAQTHSKHRMRLMPWSQVKGEAHLTSEPLLQRPGNLSEWQLRYPLFHPLQSIQLLSSMQHGSHIPVE